MLNKSEKTALRNDLFRHLDGIAIVSTAYTLLEAGVLDFILKQKEVQLDQIVDQFKANKGYLNVALRLLASQGWLEYTLDNQMKKVSYMINSKSEEAFSLVKLYKDTNHLLKFSAQFHRRKFEIEPFRVLRGIPDKYRDNYGLGKVEPVSDAYQILKHIYEAAIRAHKS